MLMMLSEWNLSKTSCGSSFWRFHSKQKNMGLIEWIEKWWIDRNSLESIKKRVEIRIDTAVWSLRVSRSKTKRYGIVFYASFQAWPAKAGFVSLPFASGSEFFFSALLLLDFNLLSILVTLFLIAHQICGLLLQFSCCDFVRFCRNCTILLHGILIRYFNCSAWQAYWTAIWSMVKI